MFRAVTNGDFNTARQLNDRIRPLAQAFYADSFVDMHNRVKEALVLLGGGEAHSEAIRQTNEARKAGNAVEADHWLAVASEIQRRNSS